MATIQYVVNAVDAASATFARIAGSADEVLLKLDEIGKKSATARVALAGDKEAGVAIDKLDLKMAALGKKVATGKIGVEGQARAIVQIDALSLKLDELGAKHVTATVDVKVNRKGLGGLLSGAAESGLSPGGGGPLAGGLGSPVGIGAIIGGGAIAAGLVPSVVGLGIGGLAGAGAVGGGLLGAAEGKKELNADLANIKTITTALKGAIGQQKTDLSAALKDANKQYSKDAAFFQPFTNLQASLQGLLKTVLVPLRTVMNPLAAIFTQFGKGLTGLGPQFAALFKASLPFIKQFLDFMLQAGKILLPAFTTAMNQMVKSGALQQMTQALVVLTQGLADFITALGPGMAASAQVFARVATFIARSLGPIGTAFSKVAEFLTADWSPAHLWNILLASAKAFFSAVIGSATAFWHNIVSVFNSLRSGIASAWNTIWANTRNTVSAGISTVVTFFRGLPGKVLNALTGLGHSLGSFASAALNEMWNGFKHVAGNILGWFKGFGKSIINVVTSVLKVFSPSAVFFDIGVNLMKGLELGVKHGVGAAQAAAKAAAGRVAYHAGAGVQQWRSTVLQALRMEGLPAYLAGRVLYQMQTESGGNPNAINLTDINAQSGDPSRGLMQVIGSTFAAYHWPGTSGNIYNPLANIAAALNYAKHVYGPTLMSGGMGIGSGHGYDSGGFLPVGASIAVNNTGRPEQVVGPATMAQVVALLAQILTAVRIAPAATSAGTARALNSAARGAMGAR